MHKKIENIIFVIIFCLIISIGTCSLFRTQKEMSLTEYRTLNKFPHFTIKSFLKLEFQNNFSKALEDQFIYGETIKSYMNKNTKFINYKNINKNICKGRYIQVNDEYSIFDCSDSLVYNNVEYSNKFVNSLKNFKNKIQSNFGDNAYVLYIYTSSDFNFQKNKKVFDVSTVLGDLNFNALEFNNYDEFRKNFYKTDHHWNYKGSYNGYLSITKLLGLDNAIEPVDEIDFDVKFIGSLSRMSNISDFYDDFKVYKFNFPEHKEYIYGVETKYGKYDDYLADNYSKELYVNHYGEFYGNDYSEVIYDYNDDTKENLLIVSNSYSNAVNSLIATHFNKTFIIDLRYYNDFDYNEYIEKNNIDKILFIGNYGFFNSEEFNKSLEGLK